MVVFPPCKINLGLRIIARRPDGYHNLETCFYPVPWSDILEIIPSAHFEFTSSGLPVPGHPEDNLCIRAYELARKEFNIPPVRIHLHKVVPMGAGLGGGSSDAAATLKVLNEIFSLHIHRDKLIEMAAMLGSDCPFFIDPTPSIGTGRGEVLSSVSVDLTGKYIVLVNAGISISTAEAFREVHPHAPDVALRDVLSGPVAAWRKELINDFEDSVFARYPSLRGIKEKLYAGNAWYAGMSGSGSTIFGLFDAVPETAMKFPESQVWSGKLAR